MNKNVHDYFANRLRLIKHTKKNCEMKILASTETTATYAFNTISTKRATAVEPMACELARQIGSSFDPIVNIKRSISA